MESAEVLPYAAVPTILFRLGIQNAVEGEEVDSISLRTQIRIAATQRRYDPTGAGEAAGALRRTPPVEGHAAQRPVDQHQHDGYPVSPAVRVFEMPMACTYDFDVVGTKYFAALEDGEIPLEFLFSGTVFYREGGRCPAGRPDPWEKEAKFRLPVRVWREMMDHYFPNSAWLRIRKDTFDRLYDYRVAPRAADLGEDARELAGRGRGRGRALTDPVEKIAATVLYEGYVLWPYRRSAQKNQRRWTFGGVYPRAYSEAEGGNDPWLMQTQCLVVGESPTVEVKVRFLHVVERKVGRYAGVEWAVGGGFETRPYQGVGEGLKNAWSSWTSCGSVANVTSPGRRPPSGRSSWRASGLPTLETPMRAEISVPAGSEEEPLVGPDGNVAGALVRSWRSLEGTVEVAAEPVREGVFKLTVKIMNTAPWGGEDREETLRQTFVSTHTILRVGDGEFVSLMDPPEELRRLAEECENVKTWPVLAGEEGDKHTVLSSPIILYDYPQDSAGEPRRPLRRGGDRPVAHVEHPQPHGRGEGGGAGHRPAGA